MDSAAVGWAAGRTFGEPKYRLRVSATPPDKSSRGIATSVATSVHMRSFCPQVRWVPYRLRARIDRFIAGGPVSDPLGRTSSPAQALPDFLTPPDGFSPSNTIDSSFCHSQL